MHEVSPQISTAVSKLPIWRNSREACQQSDTHKLWSEAKQKNCQGEGDKWSQTYLYQPFESESIGSATPKQKGAGAERPHLPVSLRSARHCLLPFPRAAFLLISSSWLSSSMAGHRNPREAAVREAAQHLRQQGRHQAGTEHPTHLQRPEWEKGHCSPHTTEQFSQFQFWGGYG